MATDYDAPRKHAEDDEKPEALPELKAQRSTNTNASNLIDEDEAALADSYELPGADLSGEELAVMVMPAQADEFTCASCFLVRHRSQIALQKDGLLYCTDCEG
ncbi:MULTISPECIES: DUF4193 domain-containing protein [Paeniglutamicibacter]|jgi:hypothetical protein|uniref:DUF4193 domain-containing protein n=1 Tax=Paeniglutamicibacter sulfureus TaxID=43666 RepID=A0ABU2BE98_9MICC|nr:MULTISPECIES: DUF4193 domain-containing protein [Paeniglutamicibacter]MCV9995357.1 DUF4193 domain-containing protein [Paeniglutamicibacter sp. ZC-3]MDO2936414.1 DUF4193 domain-containing protein [Paeniglutamicibacter sulfureus]MDR7356935.1 hypothetical protein [Paeniglutamicibacter sulfureus]